MSELDETFKASPAHSANPGTRLDTMLEAPGMAAVPEMPGDAERPFLEAGKGVEPPAEAAGATSPDWSHDADLVEASLGVHPPQNAAKAGAGLRPLLAIAAVAAIGFILGRFAV